TVFPLWSLCQAAEQLGVLLAGPLHGLVKPGGTFLRRQGLDREPAPVDGQLQRRVLIDVEQIHERAIDDQRRRITLSSEFLDNHAASVIGTYIIRTLARRGKSAA